MPRRRRVWRIVLAILVLFLVLLVYAAWPGRSTFTPGPETTYVTGPVDKYGYIDYVTALNERLRGDIKPENNANVLIWQALGPLPEAHVGVPTEYFRWLGIECPSPKGEYFVSWGKRVQEDPSVDSLAKREDRMEQLNRVSRWPWKALDYPELFDWMTLNDRPLALVVQASRCPHYYNPLVPHRTEDWSPGLLNAPLPTLQRFRDFAAALTARAMYRIGEARADDAWQDLLACHRLARLVSRGGSLIEILVGLAIELNASRADLVFVDCARPKSDKILIYLRDLQELPPLSPMADQLSRFERFMMLDSMMHVARHGTYYLEELSKSESLPPERSEFLARLFTRSVNWDPALANGNRWYDRCAAWAKITDFESRKQQLDELTDDLKALKQTVTTLSPIDKFLMGPTRRGEFIGNVMISLMLPAFQKVRDAEDRCKQSQRNLHLAFALAAYHCDHGRYPAQLEELAPKYLDKIPDDLFTGKPLIYKVEGQGYLLYSVGPNNQDDAGRTRDDVRGCDDIVVRMPVPEPKPKE